MHRSLVLLTLLVVFSFAFHPCFAASAVSMTTTYTVITGYGLTASLTRDLGAGEKLVKSGDKEHAYLVKTVAVTSEAHLLQLMGAASEAELTDLQKGLLESYRFAASQSFNELKPRIPGTTPGINLELVDITGYTDTSKYTSIKDDFWPQNSRLYKYSGNGYDLHSDIRISGTDCLGFGTEVAKRMQGTFAHEFGHAMDLTSIEANAYGFDGSHYINEKIETKASFAEGFANFIKMLFFPEEEAVFRESLSTIKIERPTGGYDEYPVADSKLLGQGFLNVEAINALIFTRIAAELPDGKKLVLDSFEKHNQAENHMSKFLQNFISDYPHHTETVAKILDRETYGRLSEAELRLILGNHAGVERYIAARSNNPVAIAPPPVAKSGPPATLPGTLYRWKAPDGSWKYSDQPPEPGTEYSTLTRAAEPGKASPIKIQNPTTNPFVVGY